MTDKPTCANCPYWGHPEREPKKRDIDASGDNVVYAPCRRMPPTSAVMWPSVPNYAWCGDHPAFPKYIKEMESDNG